MAHGMEQRAFVQGLGGTTTASQQGRGLGCWVLAFCQCKLLVNGRMWIALHHHLLNPNPVVSRCPLIILAGLSHDDIDPNL